MKILMLFVIFLLFGMFFIISNGNLLLSNADDRAEFFGLYSEWIDSLTGNGKGVAGHVVKMEWLPESG
ncbi:hypothetical protein HOE04_03125 [archaeon]|jgi:hypothetical protein|nr:hypothetical protein [archaeon]